MPSSYRKDYYEAIIQIRPYDKKVMDFIKKEIDNRESVFVSNIVEKKFGIDIYISSQRFAQRIGKKLKEKFNGELKVSRTLHGKDRQKGKLIYRVTVCFRLKQENL